jgi:hypothetical protein
MDQFLLAENKCFTLAWKPGLQRQDYKDIRKFSNALFASFRFNDLRADHNKFIRIGYTDNSKKRIL